MKNNNDTNWIIFIILLSGFTLGFIVAQAIYDKRPITEEEYRESQKSEYYE
jgi:hypothetical protein